MTIFRNNNDSRLYILEHLILDIHHLNRNAFAGVYAYPLFEETRQSKVEIKKLTQSQKEVEEFVEANFTPVYII